MTSTRREVVIAGHRGDEATVRRGLLDTEPAVRASAWRALARMDLVGDELAAAHDDPAATVRRTAAALGADARRADPLGLLGDGDPSVAEMAAWALGERGVATAAVVDALAAMARGHDDITCREAAVAALGALGDPDGLPAILAALEDRPAVRRRAVIALAPFEGPDVDAALNRCREDRDRQVADAARELLEG